MQARLIKNKIGMWLLFKTGELIPAEKSQLQNMLFNFKTLSQESSPISRNTLCEKWNSEYPDMQSVPGDTLAYITDSLDLVIVNFAPFVPLFDDVNYTIEDLYTVCEFAEKHNKSVEQIKVFCRDGRIPRAKKIGRDWVIPKDAPYPYDRRFGALN